MKPTVICIMGPTASGKSDFAIEVAKYFETDLISVDSAMVYREMDIGTAKPDLSQRKSIKHHLVDVCDPKDPYSTGRFVGDATLIINQLLSQNKVPILVGGTMLYYKALQQGFANLPPTDKNLRNEIHAALVTKGNNYLHAWLTKIDPNSAARIHHNDVQRIMRAIEVFLSTGKTLSYFLEEALQETPYTFINVALMPPDRAVLHQLIEKRFFNMMEAGLLDEVKALCERGDLNVNLPAIKSVNYRQLWDYFAGNCTLDEACQRAIIATRQLAKHQMTWLRTWPQLNWLATTTSLEARLQWLARHLSFLR